LARIFVSSHLKSSNLWSQQMIYTSILFGTVENFYFRWLGTTTPFAWLIPSIM
jgi:hypothetical protein